MECGCVIRFCLQTLAGVGVAEVAWVVSQAMQATFLLFRPPPSPCTKPQRTLRQGSLLGPPQSNHSMTDVSAPRPLPEHPRAPGCCARVAVGGQGPWEEDNDSVSRPGWAAAAPLAPGKLGDAKAALKQSTRVEAGAASAGMAGGGAAILGAGRIVTATAHLLHQGNEGGRRTP